MSEKTKPAPAQNDPRAFAMWPEYRWATAGEKRLAKDEPLFFTDIRKITPPKSPHRP